MKVIVVEVEDAATITHPDPPAGKKININELFENFGSSPDFPSIEEIRSNAWASKW